jgi:ABC-type antimicrobial peptide transport system permease subunit
MLLLAITSSIALLISLGIAAALVSVTAGVASWIPARRVTKIDSVSALRQE